MIEAYELLHEISIDYVRDKGYRPSGYAQISLSLVPYAGNDNKIIVNNLGETWKIRDTKDTKKYYGKISVKEIDDLVPSFAHMIVKAAEKGSLDALRNTLDKPVVGVIINIKHATFDLVYSTEVSFELASKEAIEILLSRAKEDHVLFTK